MTPSGLLISCAMPAARPPDRHHLLGLNHHLFDPYAIGDVVHPDHGAINAIRHQGEDQNIREALLAVNISRDLWVGLHLAAGDRRANPGEFALELGEDLTNLTAVGLRGCDAGSVLRLAIPLRDPSFRIHANEYRGALSR